MEGARLTRGGMKQILADGDRSSGPLSGAATGPGVLRSDRGGRGLRLTMPVGGFVMKSPR